MSIITRETQTMPEDGVMNVFLHSAPERKILLALGLAAVAHSIYRVYSYIVNDDTLARVSWHMGRASAQLFSGTLTQNGNEQRHVLVLGKGGAGKSRLLQCFRLNVTPNDILPTPNPTVGFAVSTAGIAGINYNFWDVGERHTCQTEWNDFLDKFDVLVWMVDSSRPRRFARSRLALHTVLQEIDELERFKALSRPGHNAYGIPVIIVAAKQDIPYSLGPEEVNRAMSVDEMRPKHNIYVVGIQVPSVGPRKGIGRLYELMSFATRKKYSCYRTCT